jgi:phenylacetic acid degradation operon negative regulatory protein
MGPAARSFVLDLLSTLRRGSMPVSALVEAAALFGIAENSVRVALARLLAAGRIERDERGRYRLGAGAEPVGARVRAWRELEQRLRSWDGGYVAVLAGPRGPRTAARRRERALRLLGLRELAPGFSVRPDNLRGGVAAAREALLALGLGPADGVARLASLDAATESRARHLWDAEALRAGYRRALGELFRSERRLGRLRAEEAMVESFLLGGRVIRQLVLDPLLPDEILGSADRSRLLAAMRRYDALGRACWAPFLERFDVPHRAAPADTRLGDAAPLPPAA